jgi:hypothetical protein
MGRYYYGDIEGKFWFAVQSSYAPERFGAVAEDVYYYDDEEGKEVLDDSFVDFYIKDKKKVEREMKRIEKNLGDHVQKFKDFFDSLELGYNDKMMEEAGLDKDLLPEYADYILGKKILDYMNANEGEVCWINAEL